MSLPDDMIMEICRKMDSKQLSKFMRMNKRINKVCQYVMDERCPALLKLPKYKNMKYIYKNMKIRMHDRIIKSVHLYEDYEYVEFSIVKYDNTGKKPAVPRSLNYKIKEVILDERIIPSSSAYIIYTDRCIDRDVIVNIYDILIDASALSKLKMFLNLIVEEYKEKLRSAGILPHNITFKNNYFIGYEYKTIQALTRYRKYKNALAEMDMIDNIWKEVTSKNGVNYEFDTTNIAPLVDPNAVTPLVDTTVESVNDWYNGDFE